MRHFSLAASQFVEGTTASIFHSKSMNKSSSYTAQIDIVKGLEHPNNRLYIRMGMKIREIELLVEYVLRIPSSHRKRAILSISSTRR